MKGVLIFIGVFISIVLHSQDKIKTLLHFEIEEATINGEDFSKLYNDNKSFLVIFKNLTDSSLSMAICWRENKSQSFGFLEAHSMIVTNEPFQENRATRAFYKWHYNNSYNEINGIANIELIQIFKPTGIYYVLKMTTDKFDLCTYKGYLVESLTNQISENK